jgi:DNA-binding IclR family transcriptional regulator
MSESVRAVERALDVLMCFNKDNPELTMTQISEKVGIHKSTAHRLLATLESKRFVQRDPSTGTYRLGIRLFQMAYLTMEQSDLRQLALPLMRKLMEQYEENIDLTILDGSDVVFINILEGPQRVKLAAAIGQRLPAFATASGKAILAFLPEKAVRRVLDRGMPRLTPATLHTKEEFFENVDSINELGFAISEHAGQPIASIAVAGPAYRLTHERMLEIGPNLVATARQISREITMAATSLTGTSISAPAAY